MKNKKYSYLNRELKSLPGERWKPVSLLEGYFMVSSLGRIKRLEYEMTYKDGRVHIKKEMIIKPEVRWHHNEYKNDYSPYLNASLVLAGNKYSFSVARLVHCTFKNQFEYYDPKRVIFYRDGDQFNICLPNLYAATISEKQKRIKEFRRSPNPFHKLSIRQIRLRHWHMLSFHLKKITQYDLAGRKIKTFPSIADAHRATGCNRTCISRTAKGYLRSCGGYKWMYA